METAAFPKIEKILRVTDTREYEEGPDDKWRPIPGTGHARPCDRCARLHEVHAEVLLDNGQSATVGTGCAGKDDMETAKRFMRADRAAKRLAKLRAELKAAETRLAEWKFNWAEVQALALPPITEEEGERKVGTRDGYLILRMGDASVWMHDWAERKERETFLAHSWYLARMADRGFRGTCEYALADKARSVAREIEKVETRLEKIKEGVER